MLGHVSVSVMMLQKAALGATEELSKLLGF